MKAGKSFKLILVAGATLSLLAGAGTAVAIAQENGNQGRDADEVQATRVAEIRTTLEERLNQRKETLQTRLTTAQATRISARCQGAQAKVAALAARTETVTSNRLAAYQTIHENLSSVIEKLEDKTDTTELADSLVALQEKITVFETATGIYKQTLADLGELDCVTDPTGFKASLESAKTEQLALAETSKAVRAHIQETIKPILQSIRTALADGETN